MSGWCKKVHGTKCPFLDLEDLSGVAFDEFLLWTKPSIAMSRAVLIAVWFAFFICLSALIGKFLVYQMNRQVVKTRVNRGPRSALGPKR
jgi:hypothetical protein